MDAFFKVNLYSIYLNVFTSNGKGFVDRFLKVKYTRIEMGVLPIYGAQKKHSKIIY